MQHALGKQPRRHGCMPARRRRGSVPIGLTGLLCLGALVGCGAGPSVADAGQQEVRLFSAGTGTRSAPQAPPIDERTGAWSPGRQQVDLYGFLSAHEGRVVRLDVSLLSPSAVDNGTVPRQVTMPTGCSGEPAADCGAVLDAPAVRYVITGVAPESGAHVGPRSGGVGVQGTFLVGRSTRSARGVVTLALTAVAPASFAGVEDVD